MPPQADLTMNESENFHTAQDEYEKRQGKDLCRATYLLAALLPLLHLWGVLWRLSETPASDDHVCASGHATVTLLF